MGKFNDGINHDLRVFKLRQVRAGWELKVGCIDNIVCKIAAVTSSYQLIVASLNDQGILFDIRQNRPDVYQRIGSHELFNARGRTCHALSF